MKKFKKKIFSTAIRRYAEPEKSNGCNQKTR